MKPGLGLIHGGSGGGEEVWGVGSGKLWNINCTKGNVVDLLNPRIIQSLTRSCGWGGGGEDQAAATTGGQFLEKGAVVSS